jgi:hypothetical protein
MRGFFFEREMGMTPYQVWVKQCDEWRCLFSSHNPVEADDYAKNRVVHGNNVQRIELRDLEGPLETYFDASWRPL